MWKVILEIFKALMIAGAKCIISSESISDELMEEINMLLSTEQLRKTELLILTPEVLTQNIVGSQEESMLELLGDEDGGI